MTWFRESCGRWSGGPEDGRRGWRWAHMGRRLGSFGHGAPRLELPKLTDPRSAATDLRARLEAYQEEYPYRAMAGNLVVGLTVGLVLGRWMARPRHQSYDRPHF